MPSTLFGTNYLQDKNHTVAHLMDTREDYSEFTLVSYWRENCVPCKMLGSTVQKTLQGITAPEGMNLTLFTVEVDTPEAMEDIKKNHGVQSVPLLSLYRAGQVVWQSTGFKTVQQLNDALNTHMSEG